MNKSEPIVSDKIKILITDNNDNTNFKNYYITEEYEIWWVGFQIRPQEPLDATVGSDNNELHWLV